MRLIFICGSAGVANKVFLPDLDCALYLVDDVLYLFSKCEIKRDLCFLLLCSCCIVG